MRIEKGQRKDRKEDREWAEKGWREENDGKEDRAAEIEREGGRGRGKGKRTGEGIKKKGRKEVRIENKRASMQLIVSMLGT